MSVEEAVKELKITEPENDVMFSTATEPTPVIKQSRDAYYKFAAFIFGICTLIGWNSMITNTVFFKNKLQSTQNLFEFFEPSLAISSNMAAVVGNLFNLYVLYRLKEFSRLIFVHVVLTLGFILLIIFIFVTLPNLNLFIVIIIIALVLNFISPVFQTSILNEVACFPQGSIQSHFAGAAFSGLFVSIIQIIITPLNLDGTRTSIIYFSITIFIILISFFLYLLSIKLKEYKMEKTKYSQNSEKKTKPLNIKEQAKAYFTIFKRRYRDAISLYLILGITLCMWPVVPLKIASTFPNTVWANSYFSNVQVFLAYNLGDFIGRYTGEYVKWPKGDSAWILITSVSRILFIIPYLLCNVQSNNTLPPKILYHDVAPIIITILFGLTNGHLFVIAFQAPYKLESGTNTAICTNLFVTLIGLGLVSGSIISLAFALI